MSVLRGMLIPLQERELEKVNAFYLQKEAEVSLFSLPLRAQGEARTGNSGPALPEIAWDEVPFPGSAAPGPPILASLE